MNLASPDPANRLRILVLGYIVRGPMGGMTWHHLQYVMGLRDLGHDVYFIEDSDDTPWCCYDPARGVTDSDPTYGLSYAARTFDRVGLGRNWAYYDAHTARWLGPGAEKILDHCARAELLINLSCMNPLRAWLQDIPKRVLVETDPVFTQIRNLTDSVHRSLCARHTAYFSFGGNIGESQCTIPNDNLPWRATRQPIVLDAWPVTPGPSNGKFTTVMQWESYPPREYGGVRYGLKSDSFMPYLDLPRRTGVSLEIALGSPSAPRELLRQNGWTIRNPLELAEHPWTYQRYLQESKAEFTVAKHGYVAARTGWFSERSAAYLASGRPVVVQDTGFSEWLPTGAGVLGFRSAEEAIAGIEEVNRRYEFHCRAARALAEECFDSRKVLARLIAGAIAGHG